MDRINADLLRTFVEVAKVEHLSRAAEALQADQSTVSRKIARLEQEVGVLLFERIGRNIRLTQAGRRLVGRAERILDDLRDAIAEAEGAVAAESGTGLRRLPAHGRRPLASGAPGALPRELSGSPLHPRGGHHRRGDERRPRRRLRPRHPRPTADRRRRSRDPSALPRARRGGGPRQPPPGRPELSAPSRTSPASR